MLAPWTEASSARLESVNIDKLLFYLFIAV